MKKILNNIIKLIVVCGWVMNSFYVKAQTDQEKAREYQLQQEAFRKGLLLQQLDSAKLLMEETQYEAADKKFKYVLDNIKSVPSDLAFFFGKNSYLLGKHKQSIDWLTKYVQLKGTGGQHYAEAISVLQKAEAAYLDSRKIESKQIEEVLSRNYDIDCGPGGKVVCPVCKGTTVIKKTGVFGDSFKTCTYCNKHGLLSCEDYNKLIRGELQPQQKP
jgi:tetratricopeptide (TPR) repeat protein